MNILKEVLHGFDVFVIFYFVALNSGYLFLIALAGFDVGKTVRRVDFAGYDSIFANPLTPGVTVLVPAFNEEPTIVETVRGLLGLRFPEFLHHPLDRCNRASDLRAFVGAQRLIWLSHETVAHAGDRDRRL